MLQYMYYESEYVLGTLWAQLLLQFWTDPFVELYIVLIMVWRYAYAFYRILKLFFFLLFSHF